MDGLFSTAMSKPPTSDDHKLRCGLAGKGQTAASGATARGLVDIGQLGFPPAHLGEGCKVPRRQGSVSVWRAVLRSRWPAS